MKCSWLGRLCSFKLRAAGDATRHFEVVTDRGHIDPVKNGDAFEILGVMTILADRKVTVKVATISAREMTVKCRNCMAILLTNGP